MKYTKIFIQFTYHKNKWKYQITMEYAHKIYINTFDLITQTQTKYSKWTCIPLLSTIGRQCIQISRFLLTDTHTHAQTFHYCASKLDVKIVLFYKRKTTKKKKLANRSYRKESTCCIFVDESSFSISIVVTVWL